MFMQISSTHWFVTKCLEKKVQLAGACILFLALLTSLANAASCKGTLWILPLLCAWTNLSQATVSLSNFQLCYRKWGELWIICHASDFFSQLAVYCYSNENTVIIYQNDFLTWPFVQTEYRWVDLCSSRGNLLAAVWCQTTHLNAFM